LARNKIIEREVWGCNRGKCWDKFSLNFLVGNNYWETGDFRGLKRLGDRSGGDEARLHFPVDESYKEGELELPTSLISKDFLDEFRLYVGGKH